jgi:hypothetical protein
VATGLRQLQRQLAPNTGATTSDNRSFTGKLFHHLLLLSL